MLTSHPSLGRMILSAAADSVLLLPSAGLDRRGNVWLSRLIGWLPFNSELTLSRQVVPSALDIGARFARSTWFVARKLPAP